MNLPTIITAGVVAAVFLAIVFAEVKKKKQGRPSCSCSGSCGSCGGCGNCHG